MPVKKLASGTVLASTSLDKVRKCTPVALVVEAVALSKVLRRGEKIYGSLEPVNREEFN